MDMAFIGAGKLLIDIDEQHDQLEIIAEQTNGRILPFLAIDPRRYDGPAGEAKVRNCPLMRDQFHVHA